MATKDGRTELINLIFPSAENSGQEFLPNSEFGAWIREREKDGKGELVYFNTSCWSKNKAIHEIEAAQSPLLINIPSTTVVYTFNTNKDNAMRLMLDSFIEEKSYAEIREEMQKNERYKKREGNMMIFPDEEAYESHVRNVVSRPVVTTIKIQDEKGHPYSFEEEVGH